MRKSSSMLMLILNSIEQKRRSGHILKARLDSLALLFTTGAMGIQDTTFSAEGVGGASTSGFLQYN